MHNGWPTILFIEEEDELLSELYKFTLINKFTHRKPSMIKVCDSFYKFGFHGDYMIGLIGVSHISIKFSHEDDYSRLFLNLSWYIDVFLCE